jgi:predicted PurR-regulated permease PerM
MGAMVLHGLYARLPHYEAQYEAVRTSLGAFVALHPTLSKELAELVPAPAEVTKLMQSGLHVLVTHVWPAWLLVFLVQDALGDADALPGAVKRRQPAGPRLWERWQAATAFVRRFMLVRSVQGLVKAALVCGLLWLLGVDMPLAWALVAFLCTFLPQPIGEPLAMIGPVTMALIGPGAWASAVVVVTLPVLGWALDELFESSVSSAVQMSAFQCSVATFVWALVLGPFGAFLAIPLTVLVRAVLASSDELINQTSTPS